MQDIVHRLFFTQYPDFIFFIEVSIHIFFSFYPPDLDSRSITDLQDALYNISSWMTANLLALNYKLFSLTYKVLTTTQPSCLHKTWPTVSVEAGAS